MFKMNLDFEEVLINAVKENPLLYNSNCKEYRNKLLKAQAWAEISKICCKPEKICRQKWKSLRDQFSRQKRSHELTSDSGKTNKLTWRHFDNMLFLKEFILSRQWTSTSFHDAYNGMEVESDGLRNEYVVCTDPLLLETPSKTSSFEDCNSNNVNLSTSVINTNNIRNDADNNLGNIIFDSKEPNSNEVNLYYNKNTNLYKNAKNEAENVNFNCNNYRSYKHPASSVLLCKTRKRQRNENNSTDMLNEVQETFKKQIDNGNDEIDLFFSSLSQKTKKANLNSEQFSVLQTKLIMFLSNHLNNF